MRRSSSAAIKHPRKSGKTPTTKAEIQRATKIAHPRFGGYLANRGKQKTFSSHLLGGDLVRTQTLVGARKVANRARWGNAP